MSDDRPTPTGLAGGSNLDQLMPVVLFFVLFNLVGIIWAVTPPPPVVDQGGGRPPQYPVAIG